MVGIQVAASAFFLYNSQLIIPAIGEGIITQLIGLIHKIPSAPGMEFFRVNMERQLAGEAVIHLSSEQSDCHSLMKIMKIMKRQRMNGHFLA